MAVVVGEVLSREVTNGHAESYDEEGEATQRGVVLSHVVVHDD